MVRRLRLAFAALVVGGTATSGLLAAAPAAAASDCPPPPVTLASVVALDQEAGPLTETFRPLYGYYQERALVCFDGRELRLTGFVAGPEGLGGARDYWIEPLWLAGQAHFLAVGDRVDADAGPVGPFLTVAVPPALEAAYTEAKGSWVRVTGHFDDPAAAHCVATASMPEVQPAPADLQSVAVDICRTAFVLTSVTVLPGPPATDAEVAGTADSTTSAAARSSGPALLAFAIAWVALVLCRRPRVIVRVPSSPR